MSQEKTPMPAFFDAVSNPKKTQLRGPLEYDEMNMPPPHAVQYLLRYAAFNDFMYQGKLAAAGYEPVGTAQVVEPSRSGLLDGQGQRAGQVVTVVMFKKPHVVEAHIVEKACEELKREDQAQQADAAASDSNKPGLAI